MRLEPRIRFYLLNAALALAVMLAGGTWFFGAQRASLYEMVEGNLTAIAQLKAEQIAFWWSEQKAQATVLATRRDVIEDYRAWVENPSPAAAAKCELRLRYLQQHFRYADILLVAPDGTVQTNLCGRKALCPEDLQALETAWREHRPIITDLHFGAETSTCHLGTVAPMFSETGAPLGAYVLLSDPATSLLPIVQSWPVPSRTAEILLVRREGDGVLFLNDLRHRAGTALRLRLPLTQTNTPAVMAILGRQGFVQGQDYRGRQVVAVILPVAGTPWIMVAKLDAKEAFAAWRFRVLLLLALLITVAMLAAAIAMILRLREQQAESRALHVAEERYAVLFSEMLNGLAMHEIICDGAGRPVDYRFLAINPAFEKMTGLKAAGVLGRTVLEVLPGTERAWIETYGQVALTGAPAFFEQYSSALKKHFQVTAFRPTPGQFACIFADITDRKRAEEEREAIRAQLLQAQKLESIGRLAGGVAHDFNNLTMAIMGYAELGRRSLPADHPARNHFSEILAIARRTANLTHKLLTLARQQTISPQPLNLNAAIADMLKMLRQMIGEDIELAWSPGSGLWQVKMDPGQTDQLLINLCLNARDAIQGVGRIALETSNARVDADYCGGHAEAAPGDYVLCAVSDTGCGMSRDIQEHIFEPFFTTKTAGEGTGLGLATVYGIVKQNKGFINLYSEPGKGSTFRIYLPRCGDNSTTPAERPAAKIASGTETILLVEDDPSVRTVTARALGNLGYTVLSAGEPQEAIRMVASGAGTIHLLITDVIMPGMNGKDLARQLALKHPGVKILFMSGYPADVIAHRGILETGLAFLPKPFTFDTLARKVREVLDGAPTQTV